MYYTLDLSLTPAPRSNSRSASTSLFSRTTIINGVTPVSYKKLTQTKSEKYKRTLLITN